MPLSNRGLVKTSNGHTALRNVPIPKLRDDYILVRTIAVALNPTDWQKVDESSKPGFTYSLLGTDYAGIVEEVGKAVTKNFKKGDRIAGWGHGGNDVQPEDGCFAEYIVAKGDLQMHIPPNLSFEDAATLGCGVSTVLLGFYRELTLDLPLFTLPIGNERPSILIYGGSTATGSLAIQFAKLSGLTVISTSSPRNFELLKSRGADHVFDYNDPECAQKIRTLTDNKLLKVFDCIATPPSAKICAEALSSDPGGLYVNLMGVDQPREDIKNVFILAYTMTGEEFYYEGETWSAVPEDYEFAVKMLSLVEPLLEKGLIKAHPSQVREGGLEGILDGMQQLKDGKVSGAKLVYRIAAP